MAQRSMAWVLAARQTWVVHEHPLLLCWAMDDILPIQHWNSKDCLH